MICPYCKYDETQVTETREAANDITRRRRECTKCKKRFTTYERAELLHLRVIKRGGNRESFEREKIKKGLLRACEKRPVSMEKIDEAVDDIERRLRAKGRQDVKSIEIGELVMAKLKKLDEVAYIRFASVYRNFKDAKDFKHALKQLGKK